MEDSGKKGLNADDHGKPDRDPAEYADGLFYTEAKELKVDRHFGEEETKHVEDNTSV